VKLTLGRHKEYNSESSLAEGVDTTHMMVAGIALTSVQTTDQNQTFVFQDRKVSSTNAERPLILAPGKETRDFFAETLKEIEIGVEKLKDPLNLTLKKSDGKEFTVEAKIKIDVSQLDGKALAVSLGLGGAYCTGCTASEEDGKNLERIKQLFHFDRSIENIQQIFDDLVETDADGNSYIPRVAGDYSTRTGVTQNPLTKNNDIIKVIPITHAYIRVLSYFEDLAYRINAKVYKMGKGVRTTEDEKLQLKIAKANFRKQAREGDLHMKLDEPDPTGSGGNTDTAAVARAFFSSQKRQAVLDLFKGDDVQNSAIEKLLLQFSVILRVISSKERKIDTEAFEQYCNETYCSLAQNFPWASIPTSVHRILGHSAERIQLNLGYGLGKYSEEGLEALHKLVRRFREHSARKTSLKDNLQDVFMHLWVRSDPSIRAQARLISCSYCGEDGHSKRSCKERFSSTDTLGEEAIFQNFFIV
jgi:hypothetical protein